MTFVDFFRSFEQKLEGIVPSIELRYKAELAYEINSLKAEKNAVILGHNYMEPALYHSICDYTGDSLELSRNAASTDKDIIVFCGVLFMAETAKILNPEKTVLIPSNRAGCSVAASITAEDVRKLKEEFPGVPVVCYVNTYAEVKAESDICCTSSNAAKVVESLNSESVIFVPDEYLARNVARETNKRVIMPSGNSQRELVDPVLIGWAGRCEVHEKFTVEDIRNARRQFPGVTVLAHPECSPEVVAESDFSGSTNAMIHYMEHTSAPRYLLLTECTMGDNIIASHRSKETVRMCSVRCPHMNQITLEDTLASLRETRYIVDVPLEIRAKAAKAVERMIAVS